MRNSLFCIISLFVAGTLAWAQNSTFSTTIGTAVLCFDDVEPGFLYNYMSRSKRSYKRELGAYWFKTSERLFGAPVTEVFVSDGSSRHAFVGVISSLPPDQLAEALAAAAPAVGRFRKLNPADKYSPLISSAGSEIVYQGKSAKIFCRHDRIRLFD